MNGGTARISIRRIAPNEGPLLREVRLRALLDAPEAFGQTVEEAAALAMSQWKRRASQASRGSQHSWLLARRGAEVVGIVHGRRRGSDTLLVFSMWVDPAVRRSGVGRMLIERLEAWARRWGAQDTALWVYRDNRRARDFYARLGFQLLTDGPDADAGARYGAVALTRVIEREDE